MRLILQALPPALAPAQGHKVGLLGYLFIVCVCARCVSVCVCAQ